MCFQNNNNKVEQVVLGNIPMFWTHTSLYVVWRMAMAEDNMVHSFGKVFLQEKEHNINTTNIVEDRS